MESLDVLDGSPFTTVMAKAAGVSRGRLRYLVTHGVVRQLFHGVYVAAAAPDDLDLRARAAALVMPAHAVVCDRSAAWLHGIDVIDFAEHDVVPDLEVVSVGGRVGSRRAGTFGGERDLLTSEIMTVHGVQVTTPIRTACDLACLRGRWNAIAVLDQFRRAFKISQADLLAMLPRFARRRGCKQLRELIPLSTDLAESRPESWTRIIIRDDGLPVPEPQVWVTLPTGRRVRVENAYRHLRVGVEYDGEEDHTEIDDVEHDDDRREELTDDGDWIILVIRKGDFGPKQREAWLRELSDTIDSRCPDRPPKRIYARGPEESSYRWRRRSAR